ncbi:MAG: hypothetical protein C0406_05865 [Sideroxydans sp.]|nr:hypothetical protein [Sideroxydans sp.]
MKNPFKLLSVLSIYIFLVSCGGGGESNSPSVAAPHFNYPASVATDNSGNIYVADTYNHTIRKITSNGAVATLAGVSGISGSADGLGSTARFNFPQGIATDSTGNIYVADTGFISTGSNHTIRKISPAGLVTTLAGTAGSSGSNDGTGSNAKFNFPGGITTDSSGNVYVADTGNSTIRKISSAGVVTTFAGTAGFYGSADGTGATARFGSPSGITSDSAGNIYVTDSTHTIRKITASGTVSTIAGTAYASGSTDDVGVAARFNSPKAIAVDSVGNLYVADSFNHTIRKIFTYGGVVKIAGSVGIPGNTDSPSLSSFRFPSGIAFDSSGYLYVADTSNHTIRKVEPNTQSVSTLAGTAGVSGN